MPLDTFGGGATQPSDISYRAVILADNLTLNWPSLSTSSDDVVTRIMDLLPEVGGFALTLPDASMVSEGQDILFINKSGFSVTIKDNAGNSIASIGAGEAKYFYLTDNTTAAGIWSVLQFGVGSSSADASQLAGLGLKAIGTTLNQMYQVVETTSDINISSSDRARLYAYTAGSHNVALPSAASVGSDFFFLLKNGGAGTITITPAGSDLIDGSSSLLVQPNDGLILYSAGSSNVWYTVALGRSVQFAFTQLVKNVGGATGDITLSSSEAQNKVITFTGTLVQSINVNVPPTVSVYYAFNDTTGPFSLTLKTQNGTGVAITQGAREICVCDGADVRRGVDNTSATTLFSEGSETAPSITFVTDPDSGVYHPAANQVGITAGGTDIMRFVGVSSAVNFWKSLASVSGSPVELTVDGSDANASLLFKAKGSGEVLFEDVDWAIRNSADTTKKVAFDASGVSTNNKRVVSFPDATGVMVLDSATQTLTNKSYQSAVFVGAQPVENQPAPLGSVVMCPAGALMPFAGPAAQLPAGWLLCYGQPISRTTYARLFSIIGVTYGPGDGSTTFNLPDLRGYVIAGLDNMGGAAANRLTAGGSGINAVTPGAAGGSETHTLLEAELPIVQPVLRDPGHVHGGVVVPAASVQGGQIPPNATWTSGSTASAATGITIDPFGSGQAHQNTQPTMTMNWIIKA